MISFRKKLKYMYVNEMNEIFKDIEANIYKIPWSDQQDLRKQVLHLSKGFVENKILHISSMDREFIYDLKITKEFLRKK